MATTETTTLPAATIPLETGSEIKNESPPLLDPRFAALKREIIKPEYEEAVTASYQRLLKALEAEAAKIAEQQQAAIPEVAWADVVANGNTIPDEVAKRVKETGCVIFRGVVPEQQALEWKKELKQYTADHRGVGGKPMSNPTFWLLYWTRPQVQARSHPEILKAMQATSKLWNVKDETLPIDMSSQVHYADRFRIRRPGDKEYVLKAHLDSSAIERWEDEVFRSNYEEIFKGNWENYDPWCMDNRPNAKVDLYRKQGSCSAFRSMQGWLSLCYCGPGEGTLRLLPSLKLSTAYILLRPFFLNETLDLSQPTFPGSVPGKGQLHPTTKWHPHLEQDRTMISVPYVRPGDYVYWHVDLAHEVESHHNGSLDSSVFYNANVPLCPYNIENMIRQRKSFRDVMPPADFYLDLGGPFEVEAQHADHGAREENILTLEGRRALGLAPFDENEPGLTEGQRKVRIMANKAMEEA
ncbi:hypothetical protein BP5796_02215 [Coleophoma crateriformis]|uniref:DUF1479-domain-containing protein n=1 Tax=Coleophoma crateriformis TaxID=565419 RepID=A0A3D8SXR2_9HELO|nr:hypothetical protein BP5796_02215 [Coleophoma crateriformis]